MAKFVIASMFVYTHENKYKIVRIRKKRVLLYSRDYRTQNTCKHVMCVVKCMHLMINSLV